MDRLCKYRMYPQRTHILGNFLCLIRPRGVIKNYSSFILLIYFFNKFIYGCVGSSLLRGLSLVAASGGYPSLRCAGFSLRWLLLLQSTGSRHAGFSSCGTWASVVVARGALEHRLSSCGTRAWLLHGLWDLPGPGLEPVSPALAGGFLTTAPPGKPKHLLF